MPEKLAPEYLSYRRTACQELVTGQADRTAANASERTVVPRSAVTGTLKEHTKWLACFW